MKPASPQSNPPQGISHFQPFSLLAGLPRPSLAPVNNIAPVAPRLRSIFKAPSRAALRLLSIAALLAGGATAAPGQSALDGFDPNVTEVSGSVSIVVVQPDGRILIGGYFNAVAGVGCTNLARLNPDGSLDTAFTPNPNNFVDSIVVQPDGRILVAGDFTSIGGQARNRMARLDATNGLADSFDPSPDRVGVNTIVLQSDGYILAGGNFTTIGGQYRNYLARLDPTNGLADSFNPNPNDIVGSIVVQADGRILAGGAFTSIGGQPRNYLARLDPATGLADSFNPNASGNIFSIAVQADGGVLAGGIFTNIGGQARNDFARLDPTTGLADSFNPNSHGQINVIAVQADGQILVGGYFDSIGGQLRTNTARLDATSGLADSLNPNPNGNVVAMAVQPDGKILVGGYFTNLSPNGGAPVARNRIFRLETDGRLDQTLDLGAAGNSVLAAARQPDGKLLIGGKFNTVLGVTRNNIARLNTDGTLDTGFDPNASGTVDAIAVQADGRILVGGFFSGISSIGGQPRNFIARLDPATGLADSFNPNSEGEVLALAVQADGKILASGLFSGANSMGGQTRNFIARLDPATGLADSFNPSPNNDVRSIAVQSDGAILAGGQFTSIGGQTRNRIARLDPATGLADSFDPNASSIVLAITPQSDGRILVGGIFTTIGGQARNRLARLDPVTGLADSFNPNANNAVDSIAVQADGKILAGGVFTSLTPNGGGTVTVNHIARLNPDGSRDAAFNPNANGEVDGIALLPDGKVLAGGLFTGANSIGGQTRSLFARLSNDTAAQQNLAGTQTNITWSRGGSSPQFLRVTLESSTDNVNYTPLGNATADGTNWTLTGLSLSGAQVNSIRARGYYRGGYHNGSESIAESVRHVFLGGALRITAITLSGNDIVITFDATSGNTYRLERKLALTDTNWQGIPGVNDLNVTNSGPAPITDPGALGLGRAFYRMHLIP